MSSTSSVIELLGGVLYDSIGRLVTQRVTDSDFSNPFAKYKDADRENLPRCIHDIYQKKLEKLIRSCPVLSSKPCPFKESQ